MTMRILGPRTPTHLLPQALMAALVIVSSSSSASVKVAFLPFEDKVKLREAWDLSVDVPRWFSQTVDTIKWSDSAISIVRFDSVASMLRKNGWGRNEYLSSAVLARIAAAAGADYLISGTVTRFKVSKQSVTTEAPFNGSYDFSGSVSGTGGVSVNCGLQSYTADVVIDVDIYGRRGDVQDRFTLQTRQNDAGFKTWLNFQIAENPEMNYYSMSRSPFGSPHFQKNIAGAVMKQYSLTVKERLRSLAGRPVRGAEMPKKFLEGKILDRTGADVYIDLGSADKLIAGEALDVLKPGRPLTNDHGDTLGWAEKRAGGIEVRFIKANHFSQARIVDESDSLRTGWTVRAKGD